MYGWNNISDFKVQEMGTCDDKIGLWMTRSD